MIPSDSPRSQSVFRVIDSKNSFRMPLDSSQTVWVTQLPSKLHSPFFLPAQSTIRVSPSVASMTARTVISSGLLARQ